MKYLCRNYTIRYSELVVFFSRFAITYYTRFEAWTDNWEDALECDGHSSCFLLMIFLLFSDEWFKYRLFEQITLSVVDAMDGLDSGEKKSRVTWHLFWGVEQWRNIRYDHFHTWPIVWLLTKETETVEWIKSLWFG